MIEALEKLHMRISDLLYSRDMREEFASLCDEIQAEIDSRYMELPLDADGVPIRVGDLVIARDWGKAQKVDDYVVRCTNSNGCHIWSPACELTHVKSRTVEEVLREFAYKVCDLNVSDDSIAKYAAELQMRGDAE